MEGSSFWRRSRRGGGGGAPLAALLVLLLPAFFPGLFTPLGQASPSVFSEWNAPKPRHLRLLEGALDSRIADRDSLDLWSPLPPQGWKPCTGPRSTSGLPKRSRGYIQVFLDGGLNQQRMGICDAVAVAKILNATLVIPFLEVNPVWKDSSTFTDIFDVDHFIDVLKDEITIVRDLPEEYSWSTREYYALGIRPTRIKMAPVHASANWYLENVLPVLRKYGIAAIAPFSHRLAFDNLPEEIQRLRCKVNFQALAFVPHITELGDTLIGRLRRPIRLDSDVDAVSINKASHSIVDRSEGKFVALHLRFDKDMAAHSACDFGGGKAEMLALAKYRQVVWQGRVLNSQFTDEELRAQGRCPLTPEEIGLMLAAMGFDRNTRLYLASHKVYGGEARLSALRQLFPLMEDKKSLASKEELARVKGKASLLAALDYYVSMHSDVFISASPGNMHNLMVGHRTYENSKSIRPNMVLLGQLFLNKTIGWGEFEQAVKAGHSNRQGQIRLRKEKQSIYTSAFGSAFAKSKIGKSRFQRARWERGAFWPRGAHLPRRPCTTRELSSPPSPICFAPSSPPKSAKSGLESAFRVARACVDISPRCRFCRARKPKRRPPRLGTPRGCRRVCRGESARTAFPNEALPSSRLHVPDVEKTSELLGLFLKPNIQTSTI